MWLYTSLYLTLPWFYFTLLCSTSLYNGSTSLYLYTLSLLSFIFLDSIRHFIWLYLLQTWLYSTLVDCTSLYHGSTSLYFTQRGYMSLYSTLLHSTMALLDSTSFYSGYFYSTGSTMAVLDSTWLLYSTKAALYYTWLYLTLPWLYFTLHTGTCNSTLLYHASSSLCITLLWSVLFSGPLREKFPPSFKFSFQNNILLVFWMFFTPYTWLYFFYYGSTMAVVQSWL